jgi:putative transposase
MYLKFFNEDLESEKYKHRQGARLQALTLMSNHTHEIFSIKNQTLFSNHMRRHHARYGMFFNRVYNRCGKVAQDRPHTTLIADDDHEMKAVFYIHANPVRARIVRDARNYPWSTHRLYAFGKKEPWMKHVKFPSWYMRFGRTMQLRQRAYRQLYEKYLRSDGRRRQDFLKKLFYGPIAWEQKKEKLVVKWRRAHAPPE